MACSAIHSVIVLPPLARYFRNLVLSLLPLWHLKSMLDRFQGKFL